MDGLRFEGFVIVSADGRLTDEHNAQPDALRFDSDFRFFVAGLRRAAIVVHGRNSGDSNPKARPRKRVLVTRNVAAAEPDPDIPNAIRWNPDGAPFERAAAALDVSQGMIAIIGGPSVYELFLDRYDVFWLTRAARVKLPDGAGVFPGVPAKSPEAILAASGLTPAETIMLDVDNDVAVTAWRRRV